MSQLRVISDTVGNVLVDEEQVELLGAAAIDAAVGHLRLGGGRCWCCGGTIHQVDDVSLVVKTTAASGIAGFIHMRCGPPGIMDLRRSRRAALALERYTKSRSSDVGAFAGYRMWRTPHVSLVVSAEFGVTLRAESGDLVNPWLELALTAGFDLILNSEVLDATPECVDGWSLRVEGDVLTCDTPDGALYTGTLDMPVPWLDSLITERQCLVLIAGVSIDTTVLGGDSEVALNASGPRGGCWGHREGERRPWLVRRPRPRRRIGRGRALQVPHPPPATLKACTQEFNGTLA